MLQDSRPFLGCLCVVCCLNVFSQEPPRKATSKEKMKREAKSNEELGALVVAAMDKEDYATIMDLMLPAALAKEMGIPAEEMKEFEKHLSTQKTLVPQYRQFLKTQNRLPLSQWKLFAVKSPPEKRNKLVVEISPGTSLTTADQKDGFELIDMTIGINGRWYIIRLCNEETEDQLTKPKGPAK